MSDYPMLISNKLHSFRNFWVQLRITPQHNRITPTTHIANVCEYWERYRNRFHKLKHNKIE